jgi:hypothetical protein
MHRNAGLGQWLAANAGDLSGSATVAELLPVHEQFHQESKAIADAIREGRILHMEDPAIGAYLTLSTASKICCSSSNTNCNRAPDAARTKHHSRGESS